MTQRQTDDFAHDFNNLLAAMVVCCDVLLDHCRPNSPSYDATIQIKQNASRVAALVRELLARNED